VLLLLLLLLLLPLPLLLLLPLLPLVLVACNPTGGYYQTSGTDDSVLLRLKEDYDGAEPAASSVAAVNLMRLAALLPSGGALLRNHLACRQLLLLLCAASILNQGVTDLSAAARVAVLWCSGKPCTALCWHVAYNTCSCI
jgi:hypothetical protein